LADEVGQLIVAFFFDVAVADRDANIWVNQSQHGLNDRRIVENAMDVSAPCVVVEVAAIRLAGIKLAKRLLTVGSAHVDFIAGTLDGWIGFKGKVALLRFFLFPKTVDTGSMSSPFMYGVLPSMPWGSEISLPHHLIAAANSV
jgi:hypothetical protein